MNRYQSMMELGRKASYGRVGQVWATQPGGLVRRKESMSDNRPVVTVVDDDESVRESLPDLLKMLGFEARAFSSAEAFLGSDSVRQTKCLILDFAMPGMSGPDLQQELKLRHQKISIVFITARRDDSLRAHLIDQGAVECLFKPFSEAALVDAIQLALKAVRLTCLTCPANCPRREEGPLRFHAHEQCVQSLRKGRVREHAVFQRGVGKLAHHGDLQHRHDLAAFDGQDGGAKNLPRLGIDDGLDEPSRFGRFHCASHPGHRDFCDADRAARLPGPPARSGRSAPVVGQCKRCREPVDPSSTISRHEAGCCE